VEGWIKTEDDVGVGLEVRGEAEVQGELEVDGALRSGEGLSVGKDEELAGEEPRVEDEAQIEDDPRIEKDVPEHTTEEMDGQEPEPIPEMGPEKAAYVSRTDQTAPISQMTTVQLTSGQIALAGTRIQTRLTPSVRHFSATRACSRARTIPFIPPNSQAKPLLPFIPLSHNRPLRFIFECPLSVEQGYYPH